MGYLFTDVRILSMDPDRPRLFRGDCLVEGRKITKIDEGIPKSFHKVISGEHLLLMPGFVNCHTHVSMSLLRGYADDLELFDWLSNRIWPVEGKLTKEDVLLGAQLGIGEMLLSGTTSFLDMYQDMDQVALAVMETGIRGHLSRGTIHTGDSKKDDEAIAQLEDLAKTWHGSDEGRIRILAGPHAVYTNEENFLKRQLEVALNYGLGVNIHVSETLKENEDSLAKTGKTPLGFLKDLGVLDAPYVVAAHMVHLNEVDLKTAREKKVGVAHNPKSNLKLGSGIADVLRLRQEGIGVGIGTDGAASNNLQDMVSELQFATLLQKGVHRNAQALPAYETLRMATLGGAEVLHMADQVGMIKEGYEADLILFDLDQPHYEPLVNDPIAGIVYSGRSSDITLTMVAGKVLMHSRELLTLDMDEVRKKVTATTKRLYGGPQS